MTESTALASVARPIFLRLLRKTATVPMASAAAPVRPRPAHAQSDGRRPPATVAPNAPLVLLVSSRRPTATAKSVVLAAHSARTAQASAPNATPDSSPAMESTRSASSLHLNAQVASSPTRRRPLDVLPVIRLVLPAMVLPPPTVSRALPAHSSTVVVASQSRLLQARASAQEATWSPTRSRVCATAVLLDAKSAPTTSLAPVNRPIPKSNVPPACQARS